MVKIDNNPAGVIPLHNGGDRTRQSEAGATFSQIMEKAVVECEKLQATMGTQACQPLATAGPSELPPLWHQIDGLLSRLDQYGQSLADPTATLKQIGPLVDEMEKEALALQNKVNHGQVKGELAELAEQAMAQVQAETIKFRRGDYI